MPSFTKTILTAVAGAATVSAHGHISKVTAGGKEFPGFSPFNGINAQTLTAQTVGWGTLQSDNGFVPVSSLGNSDIACHKSSKAAPASVTIAAGSSMTIQWDTWPDSHKGPVINYLADCGSAGCDKADASSLNFFKISEAGLENGVWAADQLIKDGNKATVTIPSSLAAGKYVLRHEIIALHEGNREGGAQMYPQCVNLEVTGGGSDKPTGVKATSLYKATDAGILFDIYNNPTSYPIPGPKIAVSGGGATGGGNNSTGSGSNNNNNNTGGSKNNNTGGSKNNNTGGSKNNNTGGSKNNSDDSCRVAKREARNRRREVARLAAALAEALAAEQ
ncbi:hypothetical protein PpBr36_07839 [Pyricularia pennisetigena]|uniref:hypothetical protein n=1 Tax=Pyricularia pennisetigena TaxID=1578925 RepID=UPI00114FC149|nr:hypothetical protein PpBr36_07839 [Pyricularia pennisetigena]TLS25506.1 hypothetical protein PpBr36_07839 [Pyricularia pennisetigena]